jgi:glycosyltransferase involved in cell wall biosynthesis
MVHIAFLVNELTSTSIPVEIAAEIHRTTNTDVQLISYYDSPNDDIDPDVEDMAVPKIKLGATGRVDFSAYKKLREICKQDTCRILHTHHNSTGSLARLAVVGTDTVCVNTEHNDHQHFNHLQKGVNSVTYPVVDVNVSNSQSTAASFEWYERMLFSGVQQEVVYNGINQAKIDAAEECPIVLPSGPKVAIVGSLIKQKNHETLLRAFRSVNQRVPESSLVVIGKGPLSGELKRLATRLGIGDSVLFTGYLRRRDDVYRVLKRCVIGVFPSWFEGFCVAAVEAMACGLPVIVSDIDVFHEVVGDPGVYADPNDTDDFAEAIVDLLQQPEKREKLGQEAKDRARTTFSLERTAREYSNLYKEVAKRSN